MNNQKDIDRLAYNDTFGKFKNHPCTPEKAWELALDWERTNPESLSNQKLKSLESILNE